MQQMTNQERKYLGEKARMQRELEQRIEEMRAEEKQRVVQRQEAEAKHIVNEVSSSPARGILLVPHSPLTTAAAH
jgi:hypothetical protein